MDESGKLTEREFAKRVGVSLNTVGRLRRSGKIDYHRYGRIVYYLQEDIDSWHQKMKRSAWASKTHEMRRAG
jgi:excisionase family DNA binding protein